MIGAQAAEDSRALKRPRAVLHVGKFYPPHRGGMETHLQTLCEHIRREVDLSVVVANATGPTVHEVVDGVPVTRLRTLASVRSAALCPGMPHAIREARADLVHVHLPNPTAILAYFASGHKGTLVATYHSDVVRQRVLGALFLPLLHRFLARCQAIICTSPQYVESSKVLAHHRERCQVLPFAISQAPFARTDTAKVAEIRARFGPRIVLASGRLVAYKGFIHLVRAMSGVDARLVIVGTGPLRDELIEEARRLGIADRVTLIGEVPDVIPYYHAADVFVLPSVTRAEAFGLVQLEAMACGKPVVNTELGTGTTYVSQHEVTGLTVPPADPGALTAAINRLLDSPELSARLGSAGRTRAAREFASERMGQETLDLYSRLLSGRGRS